METAPPTDPKRANRHWIGAAKLAVTCALLAVIFHFISIEDIWAGIQRTNPIVWLLVLVGFLIGHVVAALKWGLLVGQGIDFVTVIRAHFAGLSANIALPGVAGGDVARAAMLARKADTAHGLVTGSIVDRLIDVGILVLIAAAGATLLGTTGSTGIWVQSFAIALFVIGLATYFLLPSLARLITEKLRKKDGKLATLVGDIATYLAEHRNRILICAVLSCIIQVGFVGLNVILAWSMQGPTHIAMWLFAWPLAKLIATLPISIGGLGVREASLAAVFAGFGSASPVIVAVGLVWQTILISTGLIGLGVQFLAARKKTMPVGD